MNDNQTTELREKLTEHGIDYVADIASHDGVRTTHWKNDCNIVFQAVDFGMDYLLIQVALTPEQAIAATLGGNRESELQAALNKAAGNWAKADALLRERAGSTLTAEQVRKAVYAHSIHADCADADWRAIADELNAKLDGGECENASKRAGVFACSNCGARWQTEDIDLIEPLLLVDGVAEYPSYCQHCGFKIRKAVER